MKQYCIRFLELVCVSVLCVTAVVKADGQTGQQTARDQAQQTDPRSESVGEMHPFYWIDRNGRLRIYSAHWPQGAGQSPYQILGPIPDSSNGPNGPVGELNADRLVIGAVLHPLPEGLHGLVGVEEGHGYLMTDIIPDGPAGQAGIQPNDLLLELNGHPVKSIAAFRTQLEESGPVEVTLKIRRKLETLDVKLVPVKFAEIQQATVDAGLMITVESGALDLTGFPAMITHWDMSNLQMSHDEGMIELHKEIEALREQIVAEQKAILDELNQLRKELKEQE